MSLISADRKRQRKKNHRRQNRRSLGRSNSQRRCCTISGGAIGNVGCLLRLGVHGCGCGRSWIRITRRDQAIPQSARFAATQHAPQGGQSPSLSSTGLLRLLGVVQVPAEIKATNTVLSATEGRGLHDPRGRGLGGHKVGVWVATLREQSGRCVRRRAWTADDDAS